MPERVEAGAAPAVIHLVPHTHWDREWYEPFQTFRMRLVDLVDELLERMDRDPRLRFTLDGQVATVDDYLEVRPEAEPLIRRLIAEGRLAIGPWQILMDEFLVSGETIVRNLEMGWARAESLGRAMPVGYLPDMFGHVAQMPQILRRAGIERAVVWRGVPAAIDRNTFRWLAPDGSAVEAEYLLGGYGSGAYLFDVPGRLGAKLAAYADAHEAFYGGRSVLAMYGTDHMVPTARLADLVEAVNGEDRGVGVQLETLAEHATHDRPAGHGEGMAHWTGELRSAARANMLMGVASARIDVKVACGRVELLLTRYAEPLTAIHGSGWPDRYLELAWRRVVEDSAHDSICGCSDDAVVAQVLTRFREAEQIGQGIVRTTGRRIARAIPRGSWAAVNPSPVPRTDLVSLDVSVAEGPEPVFTSGGRRLETQELSRRDRILGRYRLHGAEIAGFIERRRHGRELFGRRLNGSRIDASADPPELVLLVDHVADPPELDAEELIEGVIAAAAAAPDAAWEVVVEAADRRLIAVRVPAPALGWSTVTIDATGPADPPPAGEPAVTDAPAPGPRRPGAVSAGERSLSNGLVDVEVADDGTFRLGGGGSELVGVGRVVDGGDFGDSYDYAPPTEDRLVEAPTRVEVERTLAGPLIGELVVRRRYAWPIGVEPSGAARTEASVATDVVTRLELRADEPFVRVRVAFDNRSRDHRVRWHIPLPSAASVSAAEGQYAVVDRGLAMEGGHGEVPLPTYPASGFVHASGVSVLLEHVLEYELVDGGRELALTLLRSLGLISRNANPYREDPAGPEIATPDAQLLRSWEIGFALMPHAGGWSDHGVLEALERYRCPFLAVPGSGEARSEPAARAAAGAGLSIEGSGVVLTALRRRGDWLEARVVAEHPTSIEAIIEGAFAEARRFDLLGRDLGSLVCSPGSLRLRLGAWEIATIRLR